MVELSCLTECREHQDHVVIREEMVTRVNMASRVNRASLDRLARRGHLVHHSYCLSVN